MNIALLEDEPTDARMLTEWLESAGHQCHVFPTGRSLVEELPRNHFTFLILDWVLPDISGDRVLRWVRVNLGWKLPVIFVTARDGTEDIIAMLEAGADDYIIKPVNLREMLARVTALGRRVGAARPNLGVIEVDSFIVDYGSHRITRSGNEIDLAPKEFELAGLLLGNIGRLLSRADMLNTIWGYGPDVRTRTIDIHVSRLRKKLGLEPEHGWKLISIYNEGYRLDRMSAEDLGTDSNGP